VAWELDTAQTFSLWSLTYLGEITELARRRLVLVKEARARGDRYALTNFGTYMMAVARLGEGEPEAAQEELSESLALWSRRGYHVQHHNGLLGQVLIHLYRGNGPAALEYVTRQWPSYSRSLLPHVQQARIDARQSRARSALAVAAGSGRPGPLLREAARDARRLARERVVWADAWALLIRAGVACIKGDTDAAVKLLPAAAATFDRAGMCICAAARRRLGQLLGGAEGRTLVEQAEACIAAKGVKDPARMAAMYTPGFPD
jgi:hypothetical protein